MHNVYICYLESWKIVNSEKTKTEIKLELLAFVIKPRSSVVCAVHLRVQREIAIHAETHNFVGESLIARIETRWYGVCIGCIVAVLRVAGAIHGIFIFLHTIALEMV